MEITREMKDIVNKALEYDGDYLDEEGYAFYYKCICENGMSLYDADEYATLNTLIGYDIGMENAMKISTYLYERDISILDLNANKEDKKLIQDVVDDLNLGIDLSKWKRGKYNAYEYHMIA